MPSSTLPDTGLDAEIAEIGSRLRAARAADGEERDTAATDLARYVGALDCHRRLQLMLRAIETVSAWRELAGLQ